MEHLNLSPTTASWGLVTSAAARARLRARVSDLEAGRPEAPVDPLPARPRRLRWSGRDQA